MARKSMSPLAVPTATSACVASTEALSQEDLVLLDEIETTDLSYWELINPSDADSDTESLHSLENGFLSWYGISASSAAKSSISIPEIETQEQDLVDHVNSCPDNLNYYEDDLRPVIFPVVGYGVEEDEDEEEEEEEDDEEEDGYGLDDELVPWQVSGKLGRQRMRKLGKRVSAKMVNSRRNPHLFVKPGCVRGKHGLGIKA